MEKVLFLDSPMKEKLYGSRRIQEKFGLGPMDKKIGEYWAISAHDNGLSKIKNGKYKGETLKNVYLNHRELFANDPHAKFPLLVKINEIQEPCSVQVHPDDAYARKYESDYGKAEFCLWLDVEEGTKIIRGHSAKTKEEFRKAIEEKAWDTLFVRKSVHTNEFVYTLAGTIHGIEGKLMMVKCNNPVMSHIVFMIMTEKMRMGICKNYILIRLLKSQIYRILNQMCIQQLRC